MLLRSFNGKPKSSQHFEQVFGDLCPDLRHTPAACCPFPGCSPPASPVLDSSGEPALTQAPAPLCRAVTAAAGGKAGKAGSSSTSSSYHGATCRHRPSQWESVLPTPVCASSAQHSAVHHCRQACAARCCVSAPGPGATQHRRRFRQQSTTASPGHGTVRRRSAAPPRDCRHLPA